MERVLAGDFNKTIADALGIAVRTVEVHRARIFEKMGVRSAVELSQLLARRVRRGRSPLRRRTGRGRSIRGAPAVARQGAAP